jgi:pimeloyl-ACP methyl ester carboxylesterase
MIQGEALEAMEHSLLMMDKKSAGIDQVWATPSEIQYFTAHVPGSQLHMPLFSEVNVNNSPLDPVAIRESTYEELPVCVQEGVHLRVMTWRPKEPVSEDPIIFVAGWVSAVSGWAPLLKVMAARRPVYYIETREKRSAIFESTKLTPTDFSIARMAEDLIHVCSHLGIASPRATVIGSSLGATALLEALKGGRLTAGTAFLIAPNSDFKAPWYLQWMLFLPAFLYHGIKYFIIWYIRTFICDVKNEPEQMMRYQETLLTAHPQRIKLSAKAAIYQRYQVWPHLNSVQIPVALAYAPTDTMHSSANIRLMSERLPHATLIACPSNKYMHSADVLRDIEAFVLQSARP